MVQGGVRTLPNALAFSPVLRGVFTALIEELQTVRRREREQGAVLERLQAQVQQAAELQRELLPTHLPRINGLEVRTLYRPAETVSGDLYDVVRLDERRVAFTLADATGHGLPAGMLSSMTHRFLTIEDRERLTAIRPDVVLAAANRELLALCLSDCQFVGALFAIYDEMTRVITFARAGLPYPILVRRGQAARELRCAGPALGMIENPTFETLTVELQPGDRLIFRTDGVDELLLEDHGRPKAGDLEQTDWFTNLGQIDLDGHLHELDNRLAQARSAKRDLDDLTVVTIESLAA